MSLLGGWKWGGGNGLWAGRPIVFGEALFDLFEEGKAIFGGAPFNVAWHLQHFGLNPLFITRIGNDGHGQRILDFMKQLGMDIRGVQVDSEHATGQVHVSVMEGHPTYHIVPNRAFDYIDSTEVKKIIKKTRCSIFYNGSLITRSQTSLDALITAHNAIQNKNIFLSLNLRPPWYDYDTIEKAMSIARWCKLSAPELDAIPGCEALTEALREQAAIKLRKRYNMTALMITLGPEGAFLVDEHDKITMGSPVVVENIIDTVGAGDAFVAVMILGIVKEWPYSVSLRRAIRFAADLCGWSGAVSQGGTLHKARMLSWAHEDIT
jgi:fructokinase